MTETSCQQCKRLKARSIRRWAILAILPALGCAPRDGHTVKQGPLASATAANTSAPSAPFAPNPTSVPSDAVALRYACDEKYESDRCASGSTEYAQWLATTAVQSSVERRLRIEEGGPLGAEWNPSNDLVLFAPAQNAPQTVRLGSKTIGHGEVAGRGWVAFRISYRDWKQVERRSTASDGLEQAPEAAAISVVEMELMLRHDPKSRPILLLTAYGE